MHASVRESAKNAIPALRGGWEHFPHEADMGVRGHGDTLPDAFAAVAEATIAVVTDPAGIDPAERVEFACSASDPDLLLYDFLNAIVYEMAVGGRLFSRFRVQIEGETLRTEAWGEPVDGRRHQPAVEIKGATFTQLAVRQAADGSWIAQCVLDI
ncbi:archease [Thioalkalivibrio paradoxus]|uniref:archease n=1 Tax=Thioalkalivibrio paradoxus TaxID=108010 RepID=UPI00022C1585|nr:archease [Thioalkalivibrio paradoxus]